MTNRNLVPPGDSNPGIELLRAYAGLEAPRVYVERQVIQHRVLLVERDATGRVVGSIERIEETVIDFAATELPLSNPRGRGGEPK